MSEPQNTDDKRLTPEFQAQAGKGRPKGVQNKTTKLMKTAIEAVLADLQQFQRDADETENEYAHFLKWAKDNETEFYKLASKLLPIQIAGDPDNPLKHIHSIALVPVAAKRDDA
jgi:hypothetical protein